VLAVDEFILEVFQGGLVKLKLPLECAVGQAATPLEHSNSLVQYVLEGHLPSLLWLRGTRTTMCWYRRLLVPLRLPRTPYMGAYVAREKPARCPP
jgi:hypothetical protein